MVKNVNIRPDGSRADVYGPKGTGIAIFESGGRFVTVASNPDTPTFAANNRAQGTAEENKAAVLGGIGTYGTYSVSDKVIILKIEAVGRGAAGSCRRSRDPAQAPQQITAPHCSRKPAAALRTRSGGLARPPRWAACIARASMVC